MTYFISRSSLRSGLFFSLLTAAAFCIQQKSATAQAPSISLDFTQSGVDINSALASNALNTVDVTSTNSAAVETFEVWVVISPGTSGEPNSNLGLKDTYWGARSSVSNSGGAFAIPTGNGSGTSTGVGPLLSSGAATSTYLNPFNTGSAFASTLFGDRNSDGVNDISTNTSILSTADLTTNSGGDVFGGNTEVYGGEALSGGGWAWEVATVAFKLPTINAIGSGSITLNPAIPTMSGTWNNWTFNGGTGNGGTNVNNNTAGDATQVGLGITFTDLGASPTPGLSLGTGTPPTRQIIGAGGAVAINGNVTNTGSGAYNYTSIVDNGSTGGLLTNLTPQSATVAATSGSNAYSATATVNSGTSPGTSVTYMAQVSDGTNTATASYSVDAVVSRVNAQGFLVGTANLGTEVFADGPGTIGAPTLSGTSTITGGSYGNSQATSLTIGSGSANGLTATQTAGVTNGLFNAASQSGTWTVSGSAPSLSNITGTSLVAANNIVTGSISMSTTGEGLAGEVTTVNIPYTYSTVGNAAADISGMGTFGGAAATASINSDGGTNANAYAGLAAQAASTFTGNGTGGAGLEHSVAEILMGSNSGTYTGGQAANVGILMRNRMLTEAPGNDSVNAGFPNGTPTSPPLANLPLISDVARLYGLNSSATATSSGLFPTDPFAFQMSFNPATLNAEGAFGNAIASHGTVYLASLIGGVWQNTILGDFATGESTGAYGSATIPVGSAASAAMGGNFNVPLLESFATFEANDGVTAANLGNYIGVYGVDTTNDEAWAVINHDSDFAVVPEPSTIVLALFGLVGGAFALRRRRRLEA